MLLEGVTKGLKPNRRFIGNFADFCLRRPFRGRASRRVANVRDRCWWRGFGACWRYPTEDPFSNPTAAACFTVVFQFACRNLRELS